MNRAEYLTLIEASLLANQPEFAVQAAQQWLTHWPNDFRVRSGLARAYQALNQWQPVHQILADLTHIDPENPRLLQRLAHAAHQLGLADNQLAVEAAYYVLTGEDAPANPPDWLEAARTAWQVQGDLTAVAEALDGLTLTDLTTPLPGLALVYSHWQVGDYFSALPLAQALQRRWPDTITLMLCQAQAHFANGQHGLAVSWLHEASALDPGGDVVMRRLGKNHSYQSLWPEQGEHPLPVPPPDEVLALLGGRSLMQTSTPARTLLDLPPIKTPATPATDPRPNPRPNAKRKKARRAKSTEADNAVPEELKDIAADLARVQAALEDPKTREQRRDRKVARAFRTPIHVLLTSRTHMVQKFGPAATEELIEALYALADASCGTRPTYLLLTDDSLTLEEFNLRPVDPTDAWQIKHQLADFDRRLHRKGENIGSLLIIGGDDIVPFHRLPNPVDDADPDVPSDNPYGTTDENYFLPEWPVGRLPSPCGSDPQPLLVMLKNATKAHRKQQKHLNNHRGWRAYLRQLLSRWQRPPSMGYTASIWQSASQAVFRPIGKRKHLFASPPHAAPQVPRRINSPHNLGYYNLHGLEEAPEWYGQHHDPSALAEVQFPVALRPDDIAAMPQLPQVVFTEACYGANILNKTTPSAALCLQFLTEGAAAVVGSTRIAYGSLGLPLIGADLLGEQFWHFLLQGHPAGEALRRARIAVAESMHKRQGFLDGEDQKTLISFVLYGDPLLLLSNRAPNHANFSQSKDGRRAKRPSPKTLMGKGARPLRDDETAAVAPVRQMLARYLPGMETGEVQVLFPAQDGAAAAKSLSVDPNQRIYAVSKSIEIDQHHTRQYARVTVSARGEVLKVAVSK